MLLSITNSCHMGCSHCMDDAKPCNEHMGWGTFQDSIDFFNHYGGLELIITGGEPFDHPSCFDFIEYALRYATGSTGTGVAHITVTTNGMKISENKSLQTALLILMDRYRGLFNIQITHVDKYYPKKVNFTDNFFKVNPVVICTEIESMYPMGRALTNNLPWSSKASKCFNIRSIVRSTKDLNISSTMLNLRYLKFCTPQIDIYGNIKLGESKLCPVVSDIYESHGQIVKDICNFKCSMCDHINKNLTAEQLNAIGERR